MVIARRGLLAGVALAAACGGSLGDGSDARPATTSGAGGAGGATTTSSATTSTTATTTGAHGGGGSAAGGASPSDAGAPDADAGGPAITGSVWITTPGGFPATGKGTLSRHDEQPAGSACGAPESTVYHTTLSHAQDPDHAWSLRIGKGSQIYSLRTALGELVGAQACGDEHPGPWIDRVLQTVLVDTTKNTADAPYFIHQAGTYAAPAQGVAAPFASPLLAEELDVATSTYRTIVWPQQAHVYAGIPWRSEVLLQQDVRDVGDGIVEITWVVTSFGDDAFDFVDQPWCGFARLPAPNYALSQPNAGWVWNAPSGPWNENLVAHDDTFGWMAMVAEKALDSRGLAVVFGRRPGENGPGALVRFGGAAPEDLTVFESLPRVPIAARSTSWFRFYLVVGRLQADHHPRGNELSAFVAHGTLTFDPAEAGAVDPCSKAPGAPACGAYFALDRPAGRARPILALRDLAQKRTLVSTDPYALSPTPWKGDTTRYLALLGWGVEADVAPGPGFVRLGAVIPDAADYPDPAKGRDVWVFAR